MINSQITAKRIKEKAKEKGVTIKKLLEDCELGVNTVGKMAKGTDVTAQTLCKIADYLNVSVDYLLGREENSAPIVVDQDAIKNQLRLMTEEEVDELIFYSEYLLYKRKNRPKTDGQEK